MSFVVGTYTATYTPAGGAAADLGRTRQGFEIIEIPHSEDIHTDDAGDVAVDAVLRGTSCELELDYMDYAKVTPALYAATGQGTPYDGIGILATARCGKVILTAAAGTTAAALDVAKVYTFLKVLVLTDFRTLLRNGVRSGPIRFKCFPDAGTSNKTYTYA